MHIENPYTAHLVATALLDARRNASRLAPQLADRRASPDPLDMFGRLRRAVRRRP